MQEVDAAQGCTVSREPFCIGSQEYDISSNTCKEPICEEYFFVKMDAETQECVWNPSAYGVGVFFIVCFALAETVAYFVGAYSGSVITGRKVDIVSYKIGQLISYIVDAIIHQLQWIDQAVPEHDDNNNAPNASPVEPVLSRSTVFDGKHPQK